MKTVTTVKDMQMIVDKLHRTNKSIGFVPTMGALHEGHLTLVRDSKKRNDVTIVSVFVNPKQFGPKEDLSKYPRPIENDKKLLAKEGVDYLFNPDENEIYPHGFQTTVSIDKVAEIFEGKSRPGHFDGMATVVLKLFNIVSPDNVYFGQKDFQQCAVVKQMIKDFNLGINFFMVPTVRDFDGLALSSRNIFLSEKERIEATNIYQSLLLGKNLIVGGNHDSEDIKNKIRSYISNHKMVRLDYVEVVNPVDLSVTKTVHRPVVILVAAFVGKTRLIDNIMIK